MPRKIVQELEELRERQAEFEDDTFEILAGEYQRIVDDLTRELEKAVEKIGTDQRGNLESDTQIVVEARQAEERASAAVEKLWSRWEERLQKVAKQNSDYSAKSEGARRSKSLPKREQEVADALLGLWPDRKQPGSGVGGQFYTLASKHQRDLADAVTRHVLGRAPKSKLVRELAEKTERSKAQAEQLIRDSTMQFSRTVTANTSDRYEFFEYRGPSDKVTRDFCREHVDRVYTRDEIDAMDNGQTGAGTVFIAGGGYNCRHAWFPVQHEWFEDDEWDELRSGVAGGTGEDPDRAYGEGNWEEADDVAVQQHEMSCGAATLENFLGAHGVSANQTSFWNSSFERFGMSESDITKILDSRFENVKGGGLNVPEPVPSKLASTLAEYFDGPFVALMGKHWVLVESVDHNRVTLADPWGTHGPGSVGVRARVTHSRFNQGASNGKFVFVGRVRPKS